MTQSALEVAESRSSMLLVNQLSAVDGFSLLTILQCAPVIALPVAQSALAEWRGSSMAFVNPLSAVDGFSLSFQPLSLCASTFRDLALVLHWQIQPFKWDPERSLILPLLAHSLNASAKCTGRGV